MSKKKVYWRGPGWYGAKSVYTVGGEYETRYFYIAPDRDDLDINLLAKKAELGTPILIKDEDYKNIFDLSN